MRFYICRVHRARLGLKTKQDQNQSKKPVLTEQDKESWPISIVSTDIDGLKNINDTLGHMAGDEAIQKAANYLRKHCRPKDILVRWVEMSLWWSYSIRPMHKP